MKYDISTLIDTGWVQLVTDLFYETTGIPASVVNTFGMVLARSGSKDICASFHRVNEGTRKRCLESDALLTRIVDAKQRRIIRPCRNGLIHAAVPITARGEHIGNFFTGRFFLEAPDMEFFRKQGVEFGLDQEAYLAAVTKTPIIEEAELCALLDYFSEYAGFLAEMSLKQLKQGVAVEAQQENEERLRMVQEAGHLGVFDWDLQTNKTVFTPQLEELFGFKKGLIEASHEEWARRVHPEDLSKIESRLEGLMNSDISEDQIEYRFHHPDGETRWMFTKARILRDKDGKAPHVTGVALDITDLRRKEELLRTQRNLATSLSATVTLEEGLRLCCETAIKAAGMDCGGIYLEGETPGKFTLAFYQGFDPDYARSISCYTYEPGSASGRCTMGEGSLSCENGHVRLSSHDRPIQPLSVAVVQLHSEDRVIGYLSVGSYKLSKIPQPASEMIEAIGAQIGNAIARLKAEEALKQANEKFLTTLESITDGFVSFDREWRYTYANDTACRLLKKRREELIGRVLWEVFPHDKGNFGSIRQALEENRPVHFDGFYPDPLNSWFECHCYPSREGMSIYFRDVTDRRKVELERERLVVAVEQAAEGFQVMDAEGVIEYANEAFCRMYGYTKQEMVGRDVRAGRSARHDPQVYEGVWSTIKSGKAWFGKTTRERKDGTVFEVESTITPIKDESGKIVSYVGVSRDITDQLRMEEQLRQSQKMEAIGTLAGGIAHDFNNVLAAIMGNAELALEDVEAGTECSHNLEQILKAAVRGRDLIRQILTFTRKGKGEKKWIAIAPLIRDTFALLRASIPVSIDMSLIVDEEPDILEADPIQIQQVLLNLITNAVDAIGEKAGSITTRLFSVSFDNQDSLPHLDMIPGEYLVLAVSDTGEGMTEKVRKRIFEPFFTTKEVSHGTGMGLTVVYGIVKAYGGAINVTSKRHKGATFTVYFPKPKSSAARAKPGKETAPAAQQPGKEHVLFVDDEEVLIGMVQSMLRRLGYQVTALLDPVDALDAFSGDPDSFDVVITDQTMPKMSGIDFIHRLREIRPDIPVILCSGHNDLLPPDILDKVGIQGYMSKPFKKQELSVSLRKALGHKCRNSPARDETA